ncbi:radical SAM protein [Frankia sp. CcI49]|uniref:FxsB family cyclophane-forming radical SAM/SPASM peptide maturase n=1 Tax=Frankia sp. CcI49 TaxID=1745382 RepID=UPI0009773A9B|nr:FxsB family cyclophane-forming radical SAM/SPASM peptide maturase [Frankia sp. CcI49]ONH59874.1 radical SAM protein [Frankia sp. CcI49]
MNTTSAQGVGGRAGEWPGDELTLTRLTGRGWQPVPFRQFVLKVNSRCNLSCTYCYVYHLADQSWRRQPVTMSREVVAATAGRIAAHAARHQLTRVEVILHGGEPLLAGAAFLDHVARQIRSAVAPDTAVELTVQTNGTLLTPAFLELCADVEMKIGVSVDGGPADNDRRRVRHDGGGSHASVEAGLRLLTSERFRPLLSGLLCVVDLHSDPVTVYENLLAWQPPAMDFLLPHGNWTSRPPGRDEDERLAPYGDWLGALFERWYSAPEDETDIRLFLEIIVLLLGGDSQVETVGLSPSSVLVIETDGTVEQVDALKSAYPGAAATGLTVLRDDFDEAFHHPGILARQIGAAALGADCAACPVHRVCGGGYYPHRYRAGSGFQNRSVYCPDLLALINRIHRRIQPDIDKVRRSK